ncbi:MAG: DISARM system helicase DrmA [Candidatus Parvarchaeum sp.]
MRDKIIVELVKELLGPRSGSTEVLNINQNPIKEYVTGIIIPQSYKKSKDPDSEILKESSTIYEDDFQEENISFAELPDATDNLDPEVKPKSFGVSFVVNSDIIELNVCITWGRYKKTDTGWVRKPFYKIEKIFINNELRDLPIYSDEDGRIDLSIRKTKENDKNIIITVSLVNVLKIKEQPSNEELAEASLFQPQIRIQINDKKMLSSFRINENVNNKDQLQFLYRNMPVYARGHMCSAIWDEIDYKDHIPSEILWPDLYQSDSCKEFINSTIRSEFVPLYPIPAPNFLPNGIGDKLKITASRLSEVWDASEIDEILMPLVSAYAEWIDKNQEKKSQKDSEMFDTLIEKQKIVLDRMKSGIQILKNDLGARFAFCFANKTMLLQRQWEEKSKQTDLEWRPFQVAFLLMNLEPICDINSKYRDFIDLLWIPTGGGKTETYLAIMAFTMALRRYKAIGEEHPENEGGTAVLTRYTLRLLTVQQFRRTLSMITAAEYLRVTKINGRVGWRPLKSGIEKDFVCGMQRFSIGMWVGKGVSPNSIDEAINSLRWDEKRQANSDSEPAQVIKCPACDTWLSVPDQGLPAGNNTFYVLIKNENEYNIQSNEFIDTVKEIKFSNVKIIDADLINDIRKPEIATLKLVFESGNNIERKQIEKFWNQLKDGIKKGIGLNMQNISLSMSRPGYFGCKTDLRKNSKPIDFEIYCPNPSCELNRNTDYMEFVTINRPDSKNEQVRITPRSIPFYGTKIPIPAYTVDEQIYNRCPTVVISTVDKIARLAFEPKTAALFGNVDTYNKFFGYSRSGTIRKKSKTGLEGTKYNVEVSRLPPPDLIIQDELHLLEGPLGSLFGLYEMIFEGLIENAGGKPKYIAATATIKNAEEQVKKTFGKSLFQFPAHGISVDSSFFVNTPSFKDSWDENKPGRIYLGVCTPGTGAQTAQIRIWTRLLKTKFDLRDDQNIKYFWTIVGYFNSIRELSNVDALYRHDMQERLKNISSPKPIDLEIANTRELSSRISSTEIPMLLYMLEHKDPKHPEDIKNITDAIFTTSMFGTGVDIKHFSLMIVDGQPKTNSQYIQATGRVGREHGGLVITFLRASQLRDLSHYELFPSYHERIHLEVEPVSVSPFAKGTLLRASGPTIVSFLRNMNKSKADWRGDDGKIILDGTAKDDIQSMMKIIENNAFIRDIRGNDLNELLEYFDSQVDRWETIAREVKDSELDFWEYQPYSQPSKNVVLGDPAHEYHPELNVVYKNALQSLREIEETI